MGAQTMIAQLLTACPSARPAWEAHLEYWGDGARGDFLDLAVFAHHIVDSHTAHHTEEFPAFFELLESFLLSGDPQVAGLATHALIEDIQNIASHRPHGYRVFEPWCRERTRAAWAGVEAQWACKSSLSQVLRAE